MIVDPLAALMTYGRIQATPSRFSGRRTFERWQDARLQRWLWRRAARVPAFRGRIGPNTRLAELPVMDKATLMANFAAYNVAGLDADTVRAAIARDRRVGPWHVGHSTGTSGNRGLYVLSDRDRFNWLGAILAKALPDFWRRRARIAVILPTATGLYDAAHGFGPMQLSFLDLTAGPEHWLGPLIAFRPTVVIAPPKILRHLAEAAPERLAPDLLYSGAEVMDPLDRSTIRAAFPRARLGEIYMATEGLIAVTCRAGRLHLCEDAMHVDLEEAGAGLVRPVLTDFSRQAQVMLRYRMNDLLRMDDSPCACGSPLRGVGEVVGREDDCLILPGGAEVTPDVVRNAVVDADPRISDFRVVQAGDGIYVSLPRDVPAAALQRAEAALSARLSALAGRAVPIMATAADLPLMTGRKLRRVERRS